MLESHFSTESHFTWQLGIKGFLSHLKTHLYNKHFDNTL